MKNFVESGEWALTVIAPAGDVVSGQVVVVGSVVGVAEGSAAAGAEVKIRPEDVYDLPKIPADALAAGAIAKVDAAGAVGLAGTKNIGWVVAAAWAVRARRGCGCVQASRDSRRHSVPAIPANHFQLLR
jgi:predicted RecA/RadA family phage recombinase